MDEVKVFADDVDTGPLRADEQERLKEFERLVDERLDSNDAALYEINLHRLYRETHDTFAAYAAERFSMAKSTAYDHVNAETVRRAVRPEADKLRRCQLVVIAKLLQEEWPQAVHEARSMSVRQTRELIDRRLARHDANGGRVGPGKPAALRIVERFRTSILKLSSTDIDKLNEDEARQLAEALEAIREQVELLASCAGNVAGEEGAAEKRAAPDLRNGLAVLA